MARRLVVVTGASSGIGAAFARQFASKGWDLALVARREDRLKELAEEMKARFGVDSLIIPADLSKANAPKEIVKAVEDAGRQIDGLVNNAGAGQPGHFTETKWTDQARFLQLMVTNYLALAHLVAPGMAERGFGRIINVSSVSALLPSANAHTRFSGTLYPGAKSLLIKFSEALHLELAGKNVHVSAVAPGYTWSEFHDVNGARATVSQMPKFWMLTAEEVATAGYDAVERGIVLRVPGAWYKFLTAMSKVLPDPLGRAVMRAQERRMTARAGANS
ncbi:oxidoreductase, short-chain dehydrogenase/reductase family [Glycocaulis alkaliphilus]|uniref:Oxidoreductase, short-chain dehydrogenase/reductase family n=1 Tax=Glycocaulis alkaliphilus TaxID=1434191 RepID=A0A3T0ECV4_9PROT|nr:SDR family oxidoreductase [Glycocaulis alkaliphilus]AZU05129.1 oxidoreductase, short-chain dehydrogenase/reductase family [Glycocaulis alkaliphilus]GGB65010.1 dehydrogenase [Glycocaulis alkaliphilus]